MRIVRPSAKAIHMGSCPVSAPSMHWTLMELSKWSYLYRQLVDVM